MLIIDKLLTQVVRLLENDQPAEAATLCEEAIVVAPENEDAWYLKGETALKVNELIEAEVAFRKCVSITAHSERNQIALAFVMRNLERFGEAADCYDELLKMDPERADWWSILSGLRFSAGDLKDAEQAARNAISFNNQLPEPLLNLALIHAEKSEFDPAIRLCQRVIGMDGEFADARFILGNLYLSQSRHEEAEREYHCALRLDPSHSKALLNLGNIYRERSEIVAAGECYRKVINIAPSMAAAHSNLGIVLKDQGKMELASESFRRALALDPTNHLARSNFLFCLCFKVDEDKSKVFNEHLKFDDLHARPLMPATVKFKNNPEPNRRLRIGLISPDLRVHPGGHFFLPIVEGLDRDDFEVFCYYNYHVRDYRTEAFAEASEVFQQVYQWTDERLEDQVIDDGIDILIEGAGHMSGNRLLVFARKPAPVQLSTALYPNTTGLSTIDYRLLDEHIALPIAEQFHSEKLIRLPETHFCYRPLDIDIQPANEPPCLKNGFITFGSFNNAAKLNDTTLDVWAKILKRLPTSRLILKWIEFDHPESALILDRFASLGVDPERIFRYGYTPDPYTPYQEVDISLDPFFASGGTTTCDSLWMGVPVVTFSGETPFARVGHLHLTNIGHSELIAADSRKFVEIAVGLAIDWDQLAECRNGLRQRMQTSPIMNEARYIGFLEVELRRIWQEWCGTQG